MTCTIKPSARHNGALRRFNKTTCIPRLWRRCSWSALTSGRITGFEALVRWQHPERGLLEPVEFISVAEETGLIVPIGWWVLREASRQMRLAGIPEYSSLTINVNFSGIQFVQTDVVQKIDEILHSTGPGCLQLGSRNHRNRNYGKYGCVATPA